jgi:hypothetical protein
MATYNKFQAWAENMVEVANCGSDTFKVAFCAAASAPVATNSVLADLATATTNADSVTLTTSTSAHSTGTYTLLFADKTITATAGGIGPFRYVVIYDDTPTSPADPLVCWYDYGSEITVANGETFTIDFTGSTFTLS